MQYEKIIVNIKVWHLFVGALLLATLTAILNPLPANDVIGRYALAAEAFADGNWKYAFHPRFGVFFTTFAGLFVWLLGVSGVVACKIVSVLIFSSASSLRLTFHSMSFLTFSQVLNIKQNGNR